MTVPYAFSAVRTFIYAGRTMRPIRAGMIEIAGAAQFLLLSVYFFP